jgi:LytS/YehU family sensor histidine kinase
MTAASMGIGMAAKRQQRELRENREAELETLHTVKEFLTAKLKQNEEVIGTLQKDINILKEVLRVEKSIT